MNDFVLKDRPMVNKDAHEDVAKTRGKSTAKMEFSLTSAAKRVGLSRNVLREACLSGELSHRKNAKDHYVIEHDQLIQWKMNRDSDIAKDRPKTVSSAVLDVRPDGLKDGVGSTSFDPSVTSPETVLGQSVDGYDESDPRIQNLLLKQENTSLKERGRALEQERDDWKGQAQKLQEQASVATRLLTDERTRYERKEAEAPATTEAQKTQPRSKIPMILGIVFLLLIASGVTAFLVAPEAIQTWLASIQ